jgi:hypothetical protein
MQSVQFLQAHLTQNGGDIVEAISASQGNQNCAITFPDYLADNAGASILGLTTLSLLEKNSTIDEQ